MQEVPPTPSPGTGSGLVTLDTATGAVTASGTLANLLSPAIAAHIHGLAPPGVNARVLIGLSVDCALSGIFSGSGCLSPSNAQGMIEGSTCINSHTAAFLGGEIHGQIILMPASGTASALAVLSLLAARRRG